MLGAVHLIDEVRAISAIRRERRYGRLSSRYRNRYSPPGRNDAVPRLAENLLNGYYEANR